MFRESEARKASMLKEQEGLNVKAEQEKERLENEAELMKKLLLKKTKHCALKVKKSLIKRKRN
ncbi:hypothetical protein AAFF39_02545 [Lactococcus garvieae]